MEMMTSLSSEQHVAKELATRLSQQEEELKDIREQVSSHQSTNSAESHGDISAFSCKQIKWVNDILQKRAKK